MRLEQVFILFFMLNFFLHSAQDTSTLEKKELKYDSSQLQPVQFDKETIREYKNDPDFNYLKTLENDSWWTRFKRWLATEYHRIINWLFGDYKGNSIIKFIITILPYLIIAGIIGFIVWLFIRLNPGNVWISPKEQAQVFLNEDEKIIRTQDISALIEEALQASNYRLAVRYYYLQLLSNLNKNEIIKYEFQKTNSEYLTEINEEKVRLQFKKLMRIYDFIWYGNFDISETDFKLAQQNFLSAQNFLKSGNEH